ncbi:MAG: acyl carrier protein [Hyphomicrobium sp.]|uniref:acyl carrier protein n=1 Tax=Hyphomicrobium sp. TaxID=82 RepID=UPI001327F24C|nr:acyl carrier protein [Hyphomicrobium sp.]KAB2938429.1 MAG: acyl carrier protein [Hyphomicrobium sp.]MBZ0211525.1 acyl carrier protein [Hyphomicrobium sp.]MCZ7596023.1 acyl carrier protein [Hyphomicrobium sp.]
MNDLTPRLIAILRKYMRDPSASVGSTTPLGELDIDHLDLPMICLDVEDAFDVQVGHGEELEELATVGDLVARLAAGLAEKAKPRPRLARRKGNWMSTGGERR